MPSFYPENNTPDPDDNELKVSQKILGALLAGVASGSVTVHNGGASVDASTIEFSGATVADAGGGTAVVTITASGVTPTGTGFTHVTGGVQDGAAKLVENVDVSNTAGIGWSKISKVGAVPGDVGAQPLDSELTALASTTSAADKVPYFTGAGTASTTTVTSAARTVLDDATVEAMQSTLKIPFISKLTKNINFSVQATEHGTYYEVTTGTSDIVCTLPDVSTVIEGFLICVHKFDLSSGTVSFTGTAGQFPTNILYCQGDSVILRANATTWEVLSKHSRLLVDDNLLGDGSDGDVTVSGAVTLTKDMYYNELTLAAGAAIGLAGYRIHCRNFIDLTNAPAGAIFRNGLAGAAASGSTGGVIGVSTAGVTVGGQTVATVAGANGGTGAGAQPTNVATGNILPNVSTSATAVQGGAGGSGSGGAGGAARSTTNGASVSFPRALKKDFFIYASNAACAFLFSGVTAQSGSAGGGDGANNGGGGGAAGKAGGMVHIWTRKFIRAGTTAANAITANGGKGGNGGVPPAGNCGGGGGAGGGTGGGIFVAYGELLGSTATNIFQAKGGDGGDGGNGVGTGNPGNGGYANCSGRVCTVDMKTMTYTETTGSAGSANSGQTGGTATEFQVSL